MLEWIVAKLKEPSTIAGIMTIAGLLGAKYSPEAWQAVCSALVYVIAAIEVIRRERSVNAAKK